MQERHPPSRPVRLGTRRRARRREHSEQLRRAVSAGGGLAPAKRAASLDTEKYLAITVQNWLDSELTEEDIHRRNRLLHNRLESSVYSIWQSYKRAGDEPNAAKWEKQFLQLQSCQREWVAYRAECCKSSQRPLAVPIGCNHRLCPLCAWHRSAKARARIKSMFDRLHHPALITLTIPNQKTIRKHDYTLFRQRVRSLIKQHQGWIEGGVYSLETTFNRQEKTWHIHVHILADLASPLPPKTDKVKIAGRTMYRFTAIKRRLEFDWLRLWRSDLGKPPRKNASEGSRLTDEYRFENWLELSEQMRISEWRGGRVVPIVGISEGERARRTGWNREFRRVVHIKPVDDREKAAFEVLKYITKVTDFADMPEAIEPFVNAVKGARLIQTFGSWYGVKLDDGKAEDGRPDWSEMHCTCGCNEWRRIGVFFRRDVEMDESGRWWLKLPHDHNSRGTVPRPTIRALDAREA